MTTPDTYVGHHAVRVQPEEADCEFRSNRGSPLPDRLHPPGGVLRQDPQTHPEDEADKW